MFQHRKVRQGFKPGRPYVDASKNNVANNNKSSQLEFHKTNVNLNNIKINYVVACYIVGKTEKRFNVYHDIDPYFSIKCHLASLKILYEQKRIPNIVKITFVVNKSRDLDQNDLNKIIKNYSESFPLPIEIKYRDNWGKSYGAWEYHIRDTIRDGYDYYFLTEDDYVINHIKPLPEDKECNLFYVPYLKKFHDKIAFVCGLYKDNHPAVSYGLYSTNVCKEMIDKYGEIFWKYNSKLLQFNSNLNKIIEDKNQLLFNFRMFDKNINPELYHNWQSEYHFHFKNSGYEFEDVAADTSIVYSNRTFGKSTTYPLLIPLV
jgi:hypothetical protein